MSQSDKARAVESVIQRFNTPVWLAKLFGYNAAMRHGVPIEPLGLSDMPVYSEQRETNVDRSQNIKQTGVSGSPYAKYALAAIAGAAAVGLPWAAYEYFTTDDVERTPAESLPNQPVERQGSLLQYLEDEGMHVHDDDR